VLRFPPQELVMSQPIQVIFFDLGDTLVGANHAFLPGALTLLTQLSTTGVRLGEISNTGNCTREQLSAQLPPNFPWGLFDSALVILSSEVHVEKPNPAIFQKAVAQAGVEAAKCLYCSENLLETLVAQAVGLKAARVQRPPHSDLGDVLGGLTMA